MRASLAILLVVVLVPSSVAASWYTCRYDNVTRSACCCPGRDAAKRPPAAPEARLRAACCCTITRIAGAPALDRASPSAPSPAIAAPVVLAIAVPAAAPPSRAPVTVARPRALDPPDTLFSRRCSLLL